MINNNNIDGAIKLFDKLILDSSKSKKISFFDNSHYYRNDFYTLNYNINNILTVRNHAVDKTLPIINDYINSNKKWKYNDLYKSIIFVKNCYPDEINNKLIFDFYKTTITKKDIVDTVFIISNLPEEFLLKEENFNFIANNGFILDKIYISKYHKFGLNQEIDLLKSFVKQLKVVNKTKLNNDIEEYSAQGYYIDFNNHITTKIPLNKNLFFSKKAFKKLTHTEKINLLSYLFNLQYYNPFYKPYPTSSFLKKELFPYIFKYNGLSKLLIQKYKEIKKEQKYEEIKNAK